MLLCMYCTLCVHYKCLNTKIYKIQGCIWKYDIAVLQLSLFIIYSCWKHLLTNPLIIMKEKCGFAFFLSKWTGWLSPKETKLQFFQELRKTQFHFSAWPQHIFEVKRCFFSSASRWYKCPSPKTVLLQTSALNVSWRISCFDHHPDLK